jgi:hypothetical protein
MKLFSRLYKTEDPYKIPDSLNSYYKKHRIPLKRVVKENDPDEDPKEIETLF